MKVMDWFRGRPVESTPPLPEIEAAKVRQAQLEGAQSLGLALPTGMVPKKLKRVQTPENDRSGPAERMMPDEVERLRDAAIRQPEPKQEPAREATRMGYTRTPQRAPSIGGMGTSFVNTRVQQPTRQAEPERGFWDDDIAAGMKIIAEQEAAMTDEQKQERDRDLSRSRERD